MTEDAAGAAAGGDTGEGFDEALEDPVDARRRRGLAGATVWMAVGTTLSRITGLGRLFALAAALGQGGLSDGYNIANTTPNIITDIVVGGVLSATFVPVFVDRLGTRAKKEAWRAISAVVTVTIVVLAVATVVFWVLTPAIIHLYTSANHNPDVHQQQQVAITLLRLFVPQLACYGLIALFTALLNSRQRFAAPMFVPIANNVVVIVVLVWFHAIVPHPSLASVSAHQGQLLLLGIGTTLGVVVQAALLVPFLGQADLHVRFLWEPTHEAMRTIVRLAGWTFGLVLANQIALVVVLALADGVKVPGAVSAYTYAYTFFQLPYGIIAVSVMSAVTPALSLRWALHDLPGFRHRLGGGMRAMLAVIIPAAVGMLLLSHPLVDLLTRGAETAAAADTTGATLAMFAVGLPGFCLFQYMIRVLQSMQDTRTAFGFYVVENLVNMVVAVVLVGPLGVRGLALSVSVAYTVAAVLAVAVLRRRLGGLGGELLAGPLRRVGVATLVMAVATVFALNVSTATTGFGDLVRVVFASVVGLVVYTGTAVLLGARAEARWVRRRDGGGTAPAADTVAPPSAGYEPGLVRLVPVGPPGTGDGEDDDGAPEADPPPDGETFRGRLDDGTSAAAPRLRPVRLETTRHDEDEEMPHGPGPGDYR